MAGGLDRIDVAAIAEQAYRAGKADPDASALRIVVEARKALHAAIAAASTDGPRPSPEDIAALEQRLRERLMALAAGG